MESMAPVTLDQLRVFLAVVDEASFSAAARALRRAQSAVSHAIATLERLLGVALFDRRAARGRKPTLTDAGRALLPEARAVVAGADALVSRAQRIVEGVEAQVTVAVDVMFPQRALFTALAAFQRQHPDVPVLLRTEALGAVVQAVLDGACQVGIAQPIGRFPKELERRPLSRIRMVPVVAPGHPLARRPDAIPMDELRRHVQLVLTDRSRLTEGFEPGVVGGPAWRLADLGTKHECLRAGFGWGSMPLHLVADDLARERLVRIRPLEWEPDDPVPLRIVHRRAEPLGPATRWLLERLGARCKEELARAERGRPER